LYERATRLETRPPGPLWHVGRDLTCFIGPLIYNGFHQHGAPVFLAGIDGAFRLRIFGGVWQRCRTAVIPAGVAHELDVGGQPIAAFYIEPGVAGAESLAPLVLDGDETDGVLTGQRGEIALFRSLYDDNTATRWIAEALSDLILFSARHARRQNDKRISHAIAAMSQQDDALLPLTRFADEVGLSNSRFQHLFTREVGVPFRRYRAWIRMRVALRHIVAGSDFTQAAHAAAFCDQAHFNHDFRRTFGAAPSVSLVGIRE
jgi:AraC-like DNA-binding protein